MKTRPDLDALTDNALMLKVKEGDLGKLGLLFERYKKPLFGFYFHMNKDTELSEDLIQTVFYRILKYRHQFRGDGDFRTWLFHIARNVSHDHFRKQKGRYMDPIEDWHDQLISHQNRSTDWQQEEELQLLSIALDRLPMDKKEILLLSKFQEKKYKEIGDLLGLTEGAVKVKVFRAMQELKDVYKELESKV